MRKLQKKHKESQLEASSGAGEALACLPLRKQELTAIPKAACGLMPATQIVLAYDSHKDLAWQGGWNERSSHSPDHICCGKDAGHL